MNLKRVNILVIKIQCSLRLPGASNNDTQLQCETGLNRSHGAADHTLIAPSDSLGTTGPVGTKQGPLHNAPLQSLPPEIRQQIPGALEYDDLRAFVHASPVFHEQYLLDRRTILCKCLERALGSATVNA